MTDALVVSIPVQEYIQLKQDIAQLVDRACKEIALREQAIAKLTKENVTLKAELMKALQNVKEYSVPRLQSALTESTAASKKQSAYTHPSTPSASPPLAPLSDSAIQPTTKGKKRELDWHDDPSISSNHQSNEKVENDPPTTIMWMAALAAAAAADPKRPPLPLCPVNDQQPPADESKLSLNGSSPNVASEKAEQGGNLSQQQMKIRLNFGQKSVVIRSHAGTPQQSRSRPTSPPGWEPPEAAHAAQATLSGTTLDPCQSKDQRSQLNSCKYQCADCGTNKSSLWRSGPGGSKTPVKPLWPSKKN
ncbi:hypothetical protein DFJ73DRAFT_98475 [Zopfochytrium polystomum]|nr:hypothetical protein DFJ73DRAFT_98475 [Zopfochytrium polystomum]